MSLSSGLLTSPFYNDARPGVYFSFDMDYHLRKRQILSSNFTSGKHEYNDVISNVPGTKDFRNATASYKTFSILYKYKVINKTKLSLIAGTGAGIMTHTRDYWQQEGNSTLRRQLIWSDLVFPVRLEANYKFSQHLQLGVIGGFFIQPDYPILAYHAGPRLTYVLK